MEMSPLLQPNPNFWVPLTTTLSPTCEGGGVALWPTGAGGGVVLQPFLFWRCVCADGGGQYVGGSAGEEWRWDRLELEDETEEPPLES